MEKRREGGVRGAAKGELNKLQIMSTEANMGTVKKMERLIIQLTDDSLERKRRVQSATLIDVGACVCVDLCVLESLGCGEKVKEGKEC